MITVEIDLDPFYLSFEENNSQLLIGEIVSIIRREGWRSEKTHTGNMLNEENKYNFISMFVNAFNVLL